MPFTRFTPQPARLRPGDLFSFPNRPRQAARRRITIEHRDLMKISAARATRQAVRLASWIGDEETFSKGLRIKARPFVRHNQARATLAELFDYLCESRFAHRALAGQLHQGYRRGLSFQVRGIAVSVIHYK